MREHLNSMAYWSRFLGWFNLIVGIIYALGGLLAFIVGAIPGIIMAILGWKLIKGAEATFQYLADSTNNSEYVVNEMYRNYAAYFKIQGILMIILLCIGVASIFLPLMFLPFAHNSGNLF